MNDNLYWDKLNQRYSKQEWVNKPSIFAQEVVKYFPASSNILELGAGNGQDSEYFKHLGYQVIATDISEDALEILNKKGLDNQLIDIAQPLPFRNQEFNVVYAHLSLHYFDLNTTINIFKEIERVLQDKGVVAILLNSTNDPENGTGDLIEESFYLIEGVQKRYFNVKTLKPFINHFETILLDESGATYKDLKMDVTNLVRFIGRKVVI